MLRRLLQGNVSQVRDMAYGPLVFVPLAEINSLYVIYVRVSVILNFLIHDKISINFENQVKEWGK